jgi:toxin ParE1/3/4
MNLVYTERALADIDLAIEWYEGQRKGLGQYFLDCVEVGILQIAKAPEIYGIKYTNVRATPIRRFPYTIFYVVELEKIVVHAVFHNRLDPSGRP